MNWDCRYTFQTHSPALICRELLTWELPKDPSVPITQGAQVSSKQMREKLMAASDKDIKIELPQPNPHLRPALTLVGTNFSNTFCARTLEAQEGKTESRRSSLPTHCWIQESWSPVSWVFSVRRQLQSPGRDCPALRITNAHTLWGSFPSPPTSLSLSHTHTFYDKVKLHHYG